MLGKQAWRLLIFPDSLTTRVFKARYFPQCNLLEASVGYRPSYVWRSVMEGLSLLKSGISWRIGLGDQVNIWNDNWLQTSSNGHPKYVFLGSDYYQTVAQLIREDQRQWNDVLLQRIFLPEDVQSIQAITLSQRITNDIVRWSDTSTGIYTVRSGYYHDLLANQDQTITELREPLIGEVYRNIWKVICPPRVKHFIWRVFTNYLPVRHNLVMRGLEVENLCPLCRINSETTLHVFLLCPVAIQFWSQEGVTMSVPVLPSLSDIYNTLMDGVDMKERCRRLCLMWGIWKIWNKYVFAADQPIETLRILATALKLGEEYLQANGTPSTSIVRQATRWLPPEESWYKVNTDASLVPEGGGQVGAIIRDSGGHYVAGSICRFPRTSHPTLLEAHGYKVGLDLAFSLGLTQVIMESDCQSVILAMQQKLMDRSDLAMIIEDCLAAAEMIQQVQHHFTPRTANGAVHALAKLPCLFSSCPLVMFTEPRAIASVIAADRQ